jgi:rRNA-processing protein EBP2
VANRADRKLSGGGAGGEDFDVGILDDAENNVSKKRKAAPSPNQSRKRQAKDEKFGFGGKKRGSKRNTAESTADVASFGRGAPRCVTLTPSSLPHTRSPPPP